ncbi:MAG: DUF6468 domain-containing protein [Proteobacteria bacterium]|nr:DUF6468 domain-containing protein [Pseudomonadota bacterium]
MELIADILLGAGALGVAVYCHVLSRRLSVFSQLENGIGGAVAVLSVQVDDMTRALAHARAAAQESQQSLAGMTERAEAAAARLELLLATMHDLPEPADPTPVRRRVLRRRPDGSLAGEEAA